jgi:hypothetical protein
MLLSNQVIQICDDLFELRSTASGVDSSNKLAVATQYAWVTLQLLSVMESYLKNKFRHHPAISSTFVQFLTQNMAAKLVEKACDKSGDVTGVASLTTQVKALAADVKSRVTLDQLNKLDSKVDKLSKNK